MHIVLVEDQDGLRKGIAYRLNDEGHSVDALDHGTEAADFLRRESCELVILDINLPGTSGLEILREMRAREDPRPVILLTARDSVADRVAGLDSGADDYLVKPFAMDELVARVRALGRRRTVAPSTAIGLGPLRLEIEPPRLLSPGGEIGIPRRELAVLTCLAEAGDAPRSKEQLMVRVYGTGADVDDRAIEVYVSRLRRRLAPWGIGIRSRRGIGYSLDPATP